MRWLRSGRGRGEEGQRRWWWKREDGGRRWLWLKRQGMRFEVRVWGLGVVERIWFEKVRRLVRDERVVLRLVRVGRGGGSDGCGDGGGSDGCDDGGGSDGGGSDGGGGGGGGGFMIGCCTLTLCYL